MSEQTETNSQQMIVIGLVVIAVLLAAVVGILIYNNTRIPEPTVAPAATAPAAAPAQAPPGMGGAQPAAPVEFDEKTATKVPKGMTPEEMLKAYHQSVIDGKYEDAYKLLPIDKQQSYGNAASYGEQVKAYGINSYELGEAVEDGDTLTIAATQVTPQMPIAYTWTFKKVGDQWYVAARTMGGQ
jgi:uncharacterized membrane protein